MTTEQSPSRSVEVERRGRTGWVRLSRPEALNALDGALVGELVAAVRELDADDDVAVVVLTGAGRAFAAGADITALADRSYLDMHLHDPLRALEEVGRLRKPVVAGVSGYALGGGCELAMMCDVVVAAEGSRFGLPELGLGVVPGLGGTQRLPRAVGKALAADMVLTGRLLDAEEARQAGLVSRVVPAEELLAEVARVADAVAARSLPVLVSAKEALQAAQETPLSEGLRLERLAFAATFALADRAEGMAAFRDRRPPRFGHR